MSLAEMLGTEFPLIQAPMAGVQDSALCIAAAGAGALGSLPCAMLTPEVLAKELAAIRAAGIQRYNLNFFCHRLPVADAAREARWRDALAPYYREHGIDPAAIPAGPGRAPFSSELAELIAEFAPPVVSFHFGLPAPELLARVKAWGALVLSSATTVEEARWLEANGADAIIAQGLEAGGHRGHFLSSDLSLQAGTFALLPQVVRAVRVPVIAAGGIADAADVAAAMALGAAGVQVGTAYMLAPEATTSPLHRAALAGPGSAHTALTNLYTGRPARGIPTRLMRELGPLSDLPPEFPLATAALAPLRASAETTGSTDFSPLWCGQNAGGCRAAPAADITRSLVEGFRR